MNPALASLFAPFRCRGLHLPNRIVMAPMTRGFSPGGVPGDDVAAYYRRRAVGGAGLIITEGIVVDHPAALGGGGDNEGVPNLHKEAAREGWRKVVEGVHAAGSRIMPQLWHQGAMREPGTGPFPDATCMRPSGIWGPQGRRATIDPSAAMAAATLPMTEEQIADVIAGFARSARHAIDIGFDGIAIHGAHGYLIDTFLWAETNVRTDKWGGKRRERARFAAETIGAIRREVGAMPTILFRFSQWKQQDVFARLAETPEQLEDVLGPIADAGVDIFDGSQRYFDKPEFDGSPLNLAGWAKKLTGKASMTVGGVGLSSGAYDSRREGKSQASQNIPALVARLEAGEFDLVGVGRSLLHDPDWTHKLRRGEPFSPFDEASRFVLT